MPRTRQKQDKVRKGSPSKAADTPSRKVREAEADLDRLMLSDRQGRGTEAFRQALSAFLNSSRSAQRLLRRHSKRLFTEWEAKVLPDDRALMAAFEHARNLETYEDGPAIGVTIYVGGAPNGSATSHRFYVGDPGVSEREVAWVDACVRHMELLNTALQAVTCGDPGVA